MSLFRNILIVSVVLLPTVICRAEVITLINGDVLNGEKLSETEDTVNFVHPILGLITLAKDKIAPNKVVNQEEKPLQEKLPGLFGTAFLEGWQRHIALGIRGEEGNDISMDINAALDISYRDEKERKILSSAYYYETDDREKDKSKGHANYIRDWLMPHSRWFYYRFVRYEYDYSKWWKHRMELSGGTGYDFYKEKKFELRGRVGLGFNKTWGSDNEFDPEGLVGMELSWNPNEVHSFTSQFMVYPNLDGFGEYRSWAQAKWGINVDFIKSFTLEFGLEHEYESLIDEDSKNDRHYDLIYFGRFGMDF